MSLVMGRAVQETRRLSAYCHEVPRIRSVRAGVNCRLLPANSIEPAVVARLQRYKLCRRVSVSVSAAASPPEGIERCGARVG